MAHHTHTAPAHLSAQAVAALVALHCTPANCAPPSLPLALLGELLDFDCVAWPAGYNPPGTPPSITPHGARTARRYLRRNEAFWLAAAAAL
jgi:hypothetical protein